MSLSNPTSGLVFSSGSTFPGAAPPTGSLFFHTGVGILYEWTGFTFTQISFNSATSFPGSPIVGDQIFRTDLGLSFYYDGTDWASTNIFTFNAGRDDTLNPVAAGAPIANTAGLYLPLASAYGGTKWKLVHTTLTMFHSVNQTLANNRTITCVTSPSGTTHVAGFSTNGDAGGIQIRRSYTPNTYITGTGNNEVELYWTYSGTTGAPGTIYINGNFGLRLIG